MIRAAAVAMLLLTAGASPSAKQPEPVRLLRIDGIISPVAARYVAREVAAAEQAQAGLILLELNTPGGLESSMRGIVQSLMSSQVPVVVYVTPAGGRAASAGVFITMAAGVAAMAPGTNIGAAHPVSVGGGKQDEVMADKVAQDAAALARSIAKERGRNADWAEQAVLKSVSITAEEAKTKNVVDLVAQDRADLLRQLDGRVARTAEGSVTLQNLAAAPLQERPMKPLERLLMTIIDPNVAYILFTLGMIGIMAELYSPGLLAPDILGGISVIVALVAFGSLPINWAGVALLALAGVLLALELFTSGVGVLAAGSVLALLAGSLLLFSPFGLPSPSAPALRVSSWLIASMVAAVAAFVTLSLRALARARKAPIVAGNETLIGRNAVAVTELSPLGRVRLGGEDWRAEVERAGRRVEEGETVQVTGVAGVTLIVRPRSAPRVSP
jgi:membrane-bound serine protease (ClpP class)